MLIHGVALVCLGRPFGNERGNSAVSVEIQAIIVTPKSGKSETADNTQNDQKKSGSPLVGELPLAPPLYLKPSVTDFEANTRSGKSQNRPYFFPSYLLDRAPVPVSAPNPAEHLTNSAVSTAPIKFRLYIDASGKVSDIDTLSADIYNENLIESLKSMFFATSFIAGNRRGNDVASYIDIEVGLSEVKK